MTQEPGVGPELDIATVLDAIAARHPDAECLVFRDRRLTWAEVDRAHRPPRQLPARPRPRLPRRAGRAGRATSPARTTWRSTSTTATSTSRRCSARYKARVAPFNVNYRYVAEELRYLLADAGATAIVFHSRVRADAGRGAARPARARACSLQVADDSGHDLLPGRRLVRGRAGRRAGRRRRRRRRSPDDLYILYTGGTTGMPKGVLWRNGDAMIECFGGSPTAAHASTTSSPRRDAGDAGADHAAVHARRRPLGRLQRVWHGGGTVVPAVDTASASTRPTSGAPSSASGSSFLLIVGDAFARPLLDELDRHDYDLSSLNVMLSGGAPLSSALKQELLGPPADRDDRRRPRLVGGRRPARRTCRRAADAATGTFPPRAGQRTCCRPTSTAVLEPGDDEVGWLAKQRPAAARLPRRRRQDGAHVPGRSTACATPCPATGPGSRADGSIELHGRDSVTINSGGEKIFAEEVEQAIRPTPACTTASSPAGRASGGAARSSPSCSCRDGADVTDGRPARRGRRATSPATSCPRRSCSSTRSSARRPARPTTAGPAASPPRRDPRSAARTGPVVARIQVVDEQYTIELATPELIEHARQLLAGEEVASIPLGTVVRDDPSVNDPWSWDIDPATLEFADMTIEVVIAVEPS